MFNNRFRKSPPHDFKIMKGVTESFLSREFSTFILSNNFVRDLLKWAKKHMTYSDEM
jgi:hypothetical protein